MSDVRVKLLLGQVHGTWQSVGAELAEGEMEPRFGEMKELCRYYRMVDFLYYAAKQGLESKLDMSSGPKEGEGFWMGIGVAVNTAADGFNRRVTQAAADVFCVEPAEVAIVHVDGNGEETEAGEGA